MNETMFENTVLAILKAAPGLGSIQVRKALCIADAVHHSLHGQSITGVKYIKEKMGPVPDNDGYRCLIEMAIEGKIEIVEEPVFRYTQNSYYAISEPDYTLFSESQTDIIKYVAEIAHSYNAGVLSSKTHDYVYDSYRMYEEIPLDKICVPQVIDDDDTPFTEEMKNDARKFFETNANRLHA
jgi:hypothetical protein